MGREATRTEGAEAPLELLHRSLSFSLGGAFLLYIECCVFQVFEKPMKNEQINCDVGYAARVTMHQSLTSCVLASVAFPERETINFDNVSYVARMELHH